MERRGSLQNTVEKWFRRLLWMLLATFPLMYLDTFLLTPIPVADQVMHLERTSSYRKRKTRYHYKLTTTRAQLSTTQEIFDNLSEGDSIWLERSALFGATLYITVGDQYSGDRFGQGFLIERYGKFAVPVVALAILLQLLFWDRLPPRGRRWVYSGALVALMTFLWVGYFGVT